MDFDFEPIDADNHYYEPLDAFTRHLDPKYKQRGVQVGHRRAAARAAADRRTGQPVHPEPDVRPDHRARLPRPVVPRPDPRRRRPAHADAGRAAATGVPGPRRARRRGLDAQGLGAVFLFPTLGLRRRRGAEATTSPRRWRASPRSTGGSRTTGASPTSTASSPRRCSRSPIPTPRSRSSTASSSAARASCTSARRRFPASTAASRSLGDRAHDPVWARLAEASMPVAFHLGDSGYNAFTAMWGGSPNFEASARRTSSSRVLVSDRAIHDTIASLVVDGVFSRHPDAAGREHRERLRLGGVAREAAEEAGQPDAVGVQGGSARRDPPQRVGDAVLRGGPARAGRPHRRRAHPVRLRLAARRGSRRTDSTSPRSSTASTRPRCARSCATTPSSCSARTRSDGADRRRARRRRCGPRSAPGSRSTGIPSLSVDEWWRIVAKAGWTAPHFTPEQGGRGLHRTRRQRRARDLRASTARCDRRAASGC